MRKLIISYKTTLLQLLIMQLYYIIFLSKQYSLIQNNSPLTHIVMN